MPKPTCSNCIFWKKKEKKPTEGECFRYPPQVQLVPVPLLNQLQITGIFPTTAHDVWCGEYKQQKRNGEENV